jgi:type I restriction enzyme S subunit
MAEPINSKVPKIRFKGFVGEWEKKTLGDLGRVTMNKRVFKHQTSEKGDVPFYKIGTFGKEPDSFISRKLFTEYKSKFSYPREGDLLISASGSIGRIVEYGGKDEYFQDSNIVWLQHDGVIVNAFLKQFYSFVKWAGLEGSTIKRLYNKNILETQIVLPDKPEQTQIGGYFREVDRLIGLQQRKHDKLVTLKKATLQKMFPQPGTPTPEIRFKGFEGDWKENKLSDLCELFTDGDWIESKDQSASGIRLLQTGNVGVNEFINKAGKARWISQDTFERLKCEEVFPGDILISRLPDPAGRACIVPQLAHRVITAVDCTIVRTLKTCDPTFLVQHFSLDSYFNTVNNFLGGGTRQRISRSALGKFTIRLPRFDEQHKIGAYFRTLDELISKQSVQLAKLKQLKSACLERMFV